MAEPSIRTIKRLYAVSGNRCAFPKCSNALVDKESGVVVGRVCHIKAASPGGPRYDSTQPDSERHGFENLLLMCPIHHDVIDADMTAYTVERLRTIKLEHERHKGKDDELPDSIANKFVTNIHSNSVTNGSIIFTQNQLGGQVAHSITNIGAQHRVISDASAELLIQQLKQFPSERVDIKVVFGDPEARQIGDQIEGILRSGGWIIGEVYDVMFTNPTKGIIVVSPSPTDGLSKLLFWFNRLGFVSEGIISPHHKTTEIVIGNNLK